MLKHFILKSYVKTLLVSVHPKKTLEFEGHKFMVINITIIETAQKGYCLVLLADIL
jgi:hypothetical protein